MKIMPDIQLTQAQKLMINALLSLLGTALMGGISAAYQYYTMGGKVEIGALINIACVSFLILFGKSLHDFVPGHTRDIIQSLQDSYSESQDALRTALHTVSVQASNPVVQATPGPAQAPVNVVIHTSGVPDVVTSSVDPLAQPLPAHNPVIQ